MKVSDYIVSFFKSKGINIIFGYTGGMITHLVDSISKDDSMKFIQVYHEQTGAIAAEGYARITDKPGVCIATSGPGATNMITGIADAYFDSIPTIYITGQVNTYEYKYDKPVRQLGFQETDVVSIVKSITKYASMIESPEYIRYELEKAFHIATSGRKGPVLLDIPMNIFRAEIEPEKLKSYVSNAVVSSIDNCIMEKAITLINNSNRPIFLIGGGVVNSGCEDRLLDIIKTTKIPYIISLKGKSALCEDTPMFMGMLGSYGNRMANIVIHQSDLVIVLGSRLDTRQTGAKYESFLKDGQIIHVDIDKEELDYHRIINNRLKVNINVKSFVDKIYDSIISYRIFEDWNNYICKIKQLYTQEAEVKRFVQNKSPYKLIQFLNDFTSERDIITTDVGQNQMWAAQSILIKNKMSFLTSGGLAPMGYSLPVAIGAAFASCYSRKVWAIVGDGGFHISTQSLQLISQYNLPISVIVINNESLGMITQFQSLYFNSNFAATDNGGGYLVPDIMFLSKAYNLPYFKLTEESLDNVEMMKQVMCQNNCVIEFFTTGKTIVSPKLEFDKPINLPSPMLPDSELEYLDIC